MSDVEVMVDCKERLAELEIVISSGMRTFAEVGRALQEIRTSGLYLQSHKTFEAYCKDRWDMRRDYADKMIKAAAVAGNLHAYNCMQIPLTESQCRPLTKLLPEQQLTAWQTIIEIADGGKITARLVNKVVKEMLEEDVDEEVKELCALAILDHDSNTYTCEKRKKPWGILDKIDPCDKCKHFVAVEEVEPEPQRHVIHKGKYI